MCDSFAEVLRDMHELIDDAPPDGRITIDTLEHFANRVEELARAVTITANTELSGAAAKD